MSAYHLTTSRSPAPKSTCRRASQDRLGTAPQPPSKPAHKKQRPFWCLNFDRKKSDTPNSNSAVADVSTPSNSPHYDLSPGVQGEAIADTNGPEELPEHTGGSSHPQIKVEYKDIGSFSPDDSHVTDDENAPKVKCNDQLFQEALGGRRQDRLQDFRERKKEWLADHKEKERKRLTKLLRMNVRTSDSPIVSS